MSRSSEGGFESPRVMRDFSRSRTVSREAERPHESSMRLPYSSQERGHSGGFRRGPHMDKSPGRRGGYRGRDVTQRHQKNVWDHSRERDGAPTQRHAPDFFKRRKSPRDYSRSPVRRPSRHTPRRVRSPPRSSLKRDSPRRPYYSPKRNDRSFSRTPPKHDYKRRRTSASLSPRRPPMRKINGDRENPMPSKCIGIFGLSKNTEERHLYEIFDKFGRIDKIQLVMDKYTGQSQGFGFIYYDSIESAIQAKEEVAGTIINGRSVRIDYSITKRAHTPTPGVYLGKKSNRERFENSSYRSMDKPRRRQDSRSPYRKSRSGSYVPIYSRRDR